MESIGCPAMFTMPSSSLSAFSVGRPTAMIVDLGHSGVSIAPVVDGFEIKKAKVRTNCGGFAMEQLLLNRLRAIRPDGKLPLREFRTTCQQNYDSEIFRNMMEVDLIRDAKHWLCVIPHYRVELAMRSAQGLSQLGLILPPSYELPDGTMVSPSYELSSVGETIFFPEFRESAEALFDGSQSAVLPRSKKRSRDLLNLKTEPDTLNNECLHDILYYSVGKADIDARKELLSSVVLTGGSSLMAGLIPRLTKELSEIVPTNYKVYCVY
jgi:actin-related protein